MTKMMFSGMTVLMFAGLSADRASAQMLVPRAGGLPPGPTVSPYLNLLRTGNSPAFNYYGLGRPQFQTNAGLQGLQVQLDLTQGRPLLGSDQADDVLITGHAAVFMNYGRYFQSSNGAGQPARITSPLATRPTAAPVSTNRPPNLGVR